MNHYFPPSKPSMKHYQRLLTTISSICSHDEFPPKRHKGIIEVIEGDSMQVELPQKAWRGSNMGIHEHNTIYL